MLTLFRMGGKNYPLDKNVCSKKLRQTFGLPQFFSEPNLVLNISWKFELNWMAI